MSDTIPHIQPLAQAAGSGAWRLALPHDTDQARLIWLARGHGQALIDGLRHAVSPNMMLYVPAETLFALAMAGPHFGTMITVPTGSEIALPTQAQALRVPAAQTQSELTTLLDAMTREQQAARDFQGDAARAHALLISVWLRRVALAAPPPSPLRADQRLTQGFARLITRDFRTGRPMADFAKTLDVTPTHLSRACKRASGQSAATLLTGRILHEARRLLSDSPHKVGRIAAYLGFHSASHFTRFVQNQTASSPTRLRAEARLRRGQVA